MKKSLISAKTRCGEFQLSMEEFPQTLVQTSNSLLCELYENKVGTLDHGRAM